MTVTTPVNVAFARTAIKYYAKERTL